MEAKKKWGGSIEKVYGDSKYVMAVYSNRTGLDVGDKVEDRERRA